MSYISLPPIELDPSCPPKHTIIFMHGLGADGNDFVPAVSELHLPDSLAVRFIFPHAPIIPVTINGGMSMRAWYDITSTLQHGATEETGIQRSIMEIERLIDRENERGIPSTHVILAGFSQGAVIALRTGLQLKRKLAGIVALSGYLPFPEKLAAVTHEANHATPIFLAHGMLDIVVPFMLGNAAYSALQEAGYPIDWHTYPIMHTVSNEEMHDISHFIRRVFA